MTEGHLERTLGGGDEKEKSMEAQAIVLFVLVVFAAGFAVYKVPKWQVRQVEKLEDRIALETEARKTLAQILGGVFFLATLYFTWNSLQVAQEGQITERFTRAIQQLGSKDLQVRLGGIYALERIAKDSPKDHWPIMEVLTAFVREPPKTGESRAKERVVVGLRADIQAILTVLGRRTRAFETKAHLLRLSGTDIRGANLEGAHLERAVLGFAHLEGALLYRAHLDGAVLFNAYLNRAVLKEASLKGVSLRGANLERADLSKTNLEGADLYGANLKGASLRGARLGKVNLSEANLEGADLSEANLEGTVLSEADMEGASLAKVIGLTREQIDSAIVYENTVLPDYLKAPPQ